MSIFNRFFKKKIAAYDVGRMIYYIIFSLLFEEKDGATAKFLIDKLKLTEKYLVSNWKIELIFAVMYQPMLVVDNKYKPPINYLIFTGLTQTFINHLIEYGFKEKEVNYLSNLWEIRFREYVDAENNENRAYWIGKKLLENLIGEEIPYDVIDFRILECTSFLTAKLTAFRSTFENIKVVIQ